MKTEKIKYLETTSSVILNFKNVGYYYNEVYGNPALEKHVSIFISKHIKVLYCELGDLSLPALKTLLSHLNQSSDMFVKIVIDWYFNRENRPVSAFIEVISHIYSERLIDEKDTILLTERYIRFNRFADKPTILVLIHFFGGFSIKEHCDFKLILNLMIKCKKEDAFPHLLKKILCVKNVFRYYEKIHRDTNISKYVLPFIQENISDLTFRAHTLSLQALQALLCNLRRFPETLKRIVIDWYVSREQMEPPVLLKLVCYMFYRRLLNEEGIEIILNRCFRGSKTITIPILSRI